MTITYNIQADNQWHLICNSLEIEKFDIDFVTAISAESYTSVLMEMTMFHSIPLVHNPREHKMLYRATNIVDFTFITDKIPCKKAMQLISIIIHKHLTKGGDV